METKMKNWGCAIARAFGGVALLAIMTACNGNSQQAATTTTATTYTLTNGVCYVTGTSTVVSTTSCGVSTTTGYTLTNGVCYITGTTTIVATTYCGTATTTGSLCLGTYFDPRVGVWGTCNGTNCRGMYMYNTSGQMVWCP